MVVAPLRVTQSVYYIRMMKQQRSAKNIVLISNFKLYKFFVPHGLGKVAVAWAQGGPFAIPALSLFSIVKLSPRCSYRTNGLFYTNWQPGYDVSAYDCPHPCFSLAQIVPSFECAWLCVVVTYQDRFAFVRFLIISVFYCLTSV